MEPLLATWKQFSELWSGLPSSQRLTFAAIPLLVLGGLGAVVFNNQSGGKEYLLAGKAFAAEELKQAQEAFQRAGLLEFEVDGGKIRVPKAQVTRYSAALMENGAMPAQYGDALLKMYKEAGLWATDSDRQKLMEVGKAQEIAKILSAITDVADAKVTFERAKRRAFGGESKVTALVSIRPRGGRQLSQTLANSIRVSVAGAVADLSAEDVVVLDSRSGQTFKATDQNDPFNSEFLDHVRRYTEQYEQSVSAALTFIPEVSVAVNVDLENLKSSYLQEREIGTKPFAVKSSEQTNTEKSSERRASQEPGMQSNQPRNLQASSGGSDSTRSTEKSINTSDNVPTTAKVREQTFYGLVPKSVQVAVQIPRDYYRRVAIKQGEDESNKQAFAAKLQSLEQETKKEVQAIVAKLIPANSPTDAITVTSFTGLDGAPETSGPSLLERGIEFGVRWAGPITLGLFTLWALWMFNSSLKKLPSAPPIAPPDASKAAAAKAAADGDEDDDEEDNRPLTKRDQLQGLVRENPEMAAAVISKWLAPTK